MKINKIAICLLTVGFTTASSQAALITLINGAGAAASGIETTEGFTFRGGTLPGDPLGGTNAGISAGPGTVAFGIFSTILEPGALPDIGSFVPFGDIGTFAAGGPAGNRSVFSLPRNVAVSGSVFEGQNMILFAGNGLTFESSTQWLVVNTNVGFSSVSDDTPTPTTFIVRPENSTVLFGSVVPNVWTTNTDTSVTAGWQMVPEPSAALLGLLGAVGLLRRRRN